MSGVAHHLSPCRGRNCGALLLETEMTKASKILGEGKRGYLCDRCVTLYSRFPGVDR